MTLSDHIIQEAFEND